MTPDSMLIAATLATPLILLVVCLAASPFNRGKMLLPFAPLPAVATALLASDDASLVLPDALFGLTFQLDTPARLLLGTSALLWCAAGAYAISYPRASTNERRFTTWWLVTLFGSLGVFIAADLPCFYLFFTIVSLAAYWLIIDDETPSARHVGAVYVSFALLGEAFLLLAFVLMASSAPGSSLLIRDSIGVIAASPGRDAIVALIILGFGVKIGLVPLHVWMPLTYTAAPVPVAAVLSGAAVKAGVIGLIRFLPFDVPMPEWGQWLAALGMFGAFFGVIIGITQTNAKTILAYSSVSQMGLIAAVCGMGLAAGNAGVTTLAAFYALHHVLVKGGLFLAIGVASQAGARRWWPTLLPAGFIALGLGGLPLTGGALAKLAIKPAMGDGAVATLSMLSAAASTLIMLHFVQRLRHVGQNAQEVAPAGFVGPWLLIAAAAVGLPWFLFTQVTHQALADVFTLKTLWELSWPVLVGALLAAGLRHAGKLMPRIPAGDLLAGALALGPLVRSLGSAMERIDADLRRFSVGGAVFLAVAVLLAATMFVNP